MNMSELEIPSTATDKDESTVDNSLSVVSASGYLADEENVDETIRESQVVETGEEFQNNDTLEESKDDSASRLSLTVIQVVLKRVQDPMKSFVSDAFYITAKTVGDLPIIRTGRKMVRSMVCDALSAKSAVLARVDRCKDMLTESLYEEKPIPADSNLIESRELRYVLLKNSLMFLHTMLKRYENITFKHLQRVRRFRRCIKAFQDCPPTILSPTVNNIKELNEETEEEMEPISKHPRYDSVENVSPTTNPSVTARVFQWFVGPVTPDRYKFSDGECTNDLLKRAETESYYSSEDPDFEPNSPEILNDSSSADSNTSSEKEELLEELKDIISQVNEQEIQG